MRKQKVFNRVSAWLLVWTMVLSALAGNVTVRAEEPEEVDVQIEAETDVQTEADADMQIEAETDVQTEEDADMQIEANQTPEDGEDELPTGLVVYTWLNWEDRDGDDGNQIWGYAGKGIAKDADGNTIDEAKPGKGANIGFGRETWYLVERDEDGNETPVAINDLVVQKKGENDEWDNVTDNDNIYELTTSDEVFDNVENAQSYIKFYFKEIGDYRIYKDDEENCIEVYAETPYTGFYKTDKLSFDNYIEQHEYKTTEEERTIYAIIYAPEHFKVQLDGENADRTPCGVSFDGGEDAFEGTDYFVERVDQEDPDEMGSERYYTYKITIAEDCLKNFSLRVATQVTYNDGENEDSWSYSRDIALNCPPDGLNILWPWGDNGYVEYNERNTEEACKSTSGELDPNGHHIYLCTKSENGGLEQITDEDGITLSFKADGEDRYTPITDANKTTYGSIEKCIDTEHGHTDEDGNVFEGMFLFKPKKEGVYKISYSDSSFATFEAHCPGFGFYKGAKISAENYLGHDLNYYSKDGDIRTIYFLKMEGMDEINAAKEIGDVHAVWGDQDKTDIFIEDIQPVDNVDGVDSGWKITINPECQQDFDLRVDIMEKQEDSQWESIGWESIWLYYNNPSKPHKSGSDGPDKAFSGCMITEWEFQSWLGFWENNCTPDNIEYWVHGDTVQEVLDKLAALESEEIEVKYFDESQQEVKTESVTIRQTGYYHIAMSCYTGNEAGEAKQKTEQIVALPKGVKGVYMESSSQQEVSWADENPDFENPEGILGIYSIYTGNIHDTLTEDQYNNGEYDKDAVEENRVLACYFGSDAEDDVPLGWYEVEWNETAGIYVRNTDKPVKDQDGNSIPGPNEYPEYWKNEIVYRDIHHEFIWPDLVLDATNGLAPVKLDGQWAKDKGVTIKYSNKKAAKFEITVCGTKITNEDAVKGTPITLYEKDEEGNDTTIVVTTVSFEYVACDHKGQSGVTKDAKAATCTENGYTGDTYCTDCDTKTASGTAIPATGHKWDAGKVTKEATTTEKGVKTYTCQVCKQTKTEDIPVLEKKPDPTPAQKPQGTKIPDSAGNTYKVTSDPQAKEPTVEYTAPKKGAKGTVKVPDSVTVDGVDYKVTAIADNAFKGNKNLTKVTVGKNITSIGKNAFSGCTKLKTVTVGANVEKIGDSAFKGCAAVTKITLPAKVQKIGKNAFDGCKKLKTITIKSTKLTAKNISKGAFKGVTTKTTIKVPKSKVKAYKKLFQAKGLSKKVKVKA